MIPRRKIYRPNHCHNYVYTTRPAGFEPATYGLEEQGEPHTRDNRRLITGFDARRRSPTIIDAVTASVLIPVAFLSLKFLYRRVSDPVLVAPEEIRL